MKKHPNEVIIEALLGGVNRVIEYGRSTNFVFNIENLDGKIIPVEIVVQPHKEDGDYDA